MLDINDNAPVFTQNVYKSTIAENLRLDPPAAILQVLAEDKDDGINGKLQYKIVEQSEPGKIPFAKITNTLFYLDDVISTSVVIVNQYKT